MIDNTVPSVAASMKDENPDEDESGVRNGEGKRVERGPIILLFNPLKVEAHQSESP